jgi:hypothetical protein
MRAVLVVSLVILFCPAAAVAQSAPATSTATAASSTKPAKGGDITRAEYIERAVERAKRAAEKRFDKMDANHDGVLTADERRDARASRPPRRAKSTQ